MNITLIVAVSDNDVIGKDGKVPWKIPEDMKRFKRLTMGHPVIMGRKTYESIEEKYRPLKGRKNIVLTNGPRPSGDIYVARDVYEAIDLCVDEDSYIIGGEKVYEEFSLLARRMEITRVHANYEGDAFFEFDPRGWKKIADLEMAGNLPHYPSYSFLTYVRR